MFHDVAILLGLFAWLGKPLDGVFLAALLTVIGYSVNDSVVVFDRIRERLRGRTREPLDRLANDACLQTIPRTINTGLGALFILAALFVLGGDTLTDFALALLVGILVGTYSSVFVATPLLVAFEQRSGAQPATAPRPAAREPATETVAARGQSRAGADRSRGTGPRPRTNAPRPKQRKQPTRRNKGRRR
jgi:SecD/SecF fusion protein